MKSRRRDRNRSTDNQQRARSDGNSSNRNRRQRGSGGSPNNQQKRGSSNRGRRRGRGRSRAQQGAGFWGDAERLPTEQHELRITDAPAAVPRSLGRPPLPGHEAIAEHYFGVVYERAVSTATALAAAGGLLDTEALLDHDDEG